MSKLLNWTGIAAGVLASLSCLVAPAGAKSKFTVIDAPDASITMARSISDGIITGTADNQGFVRTRDGTFTEFSAPDAAFGTEPASISKGAVTGSYVDSNGLFHGFVRAADGTITEFDPSGSGGTTSASINDKGVVVGGYVDGNIGHSFIRAADGTITTFDPAGASSSGAIGINGSGVIAGSFEENSVTHGYVRAADGTITTFDPPNSTYTLAQSIDAGGAIAGWYGNGSALLGFVRAADGTFATFDAESSGNNDVFAIDNKGQVTGDYVENNDGVPHGFEYQPSGKIKSFDPPQSVYTMPSGIGSGRDAGAIVGYFVDKDGNYHGFLRSP